MYVLAILSLIVFNAQANHNGDIFGNVTFVSLEADDFDAQLLGALYQTEEIITTLMTGHRWEIWEIDMDKYPIDHTTLGDDYGIRVHVLDEPQFDMRASIRKNDINFDDGNNIDSEIWTPGWQWGEDDTVRVCDVETGMYYMNISWADTVYNESSSEASVRWEINIEKTGDDFFGCGDGEDAIAAFLIVVLIVVICAVCCIVGCIVACVCGAGAGCAICCCGRKDKEHEGGVEVTTTLAE